MKKHCLMFEVLTVVTKKITVFYTVMLCSLVNTYQYLGVNCCLIFRIEDFLMSHFQIYCSKVIFFLHILVCISCLLMHDMCHYGLK